MGLHPSPVTMPTTTTRFSHQASRRDSWPPTQVRILNSIKSEDMSMDMDKHDDHTSFIDDDDPMNSFLTPTPLLDDGDTDDEDADMDMDFAFDAGIEDPHNPAPIIRSISPSNLASGGLPRPPSTPPRAIPAPIRTPSPPQHFLRRAGSYSPPSRNSPEITTPILDEDDEEEEEDYVRLTPRGGGLTVPPSPFNLGSSKSRASKMRRAKAAAVAAAKVQEKEEDKIALMMARGYHEKDDNNNEAPSSSSSSLFLAPSPEFHVGRPPVANGTRGRSASAFGRPPMLPSRPRSWSGASGYGSGRLSPRAWREPSPDVWSIEEEEEEDDDDEEDMDVVDSLRDHYHQAVARKDGKSQKRVRFAWPVREEIS